MNLRHVRYQTMVGGALVALALLLAACSGDGDTADAPATTAAPASSTEAPLPFEGQELRVQVWPGSYEDVYVEYVFSKFSELTGATVVPSTTYEFIAVPQIQQEVDSGDPQVDVTVLLPSDVVRAGELGLLEPMTEDNVPNLATLRPQARELLPAGVGYLVYTYGFGVRTDIEERVGFKPECWLDLFDSRLKGRVATGLTVPTYTIQQMNLALYGEMTPVQEGSWEKLDELLPNIQALYPSPAGMEDALVRGEADVAIVFDGRVWAMADAGVPVEFISPCEGAYANQDFFGIVKGTKNLDLAYEFVNFALGAQAQRDVALNLAYGPTSLQAEFDDSELGRFVYGDEAWDTLAFEDFLYVAEVSGEWTDRWNEWAAKLGG